MELAEEILINWNTDIYGYAHRVATLDDEGYPTWTVNNGDSFGVVIPYSGEEEINESFANVRIISKDVIFEGGNVKRALTMLTGLNENKESFAAFCAAFVSPGSDGAKRDKIMQSPLEWWQTWKEMLGNKNIDPRIYDVLGELCVLREFVLQGADVSWNGPNRASYDIEMEERFVEVKSTLSRDKREVTVSNQFQLQESKQLWLVLCQFEPSVLSGLSIDSVVAELGDAGYNTAVIEEKLADMGLEYGMSSRKKTFILHDMLQYTVDESFPKITPQSFIGGVLPQGIVKISYTVDLSGRDAKSLIHGEQK